MNIIYVLRVLLYGLLSLFIGYSTVRIIPIFTPLGGIIEAGIFFFSALLIHEIVVYQRQREKFQNHQLNFSAETKRLNKDLYMLQQSLIKTIEKFKLPFPKLPVVEEIGNLEKSLQKKDLDPKNLIRLLDLQIQILQPLVSTLSSLSNPDFFQDFKSGPSFASIPLNSMTSAPNFSSMQAPDFVPSLSSLTKENSSTFRRMSDFLPYNKTTLDLPSFPKVEPEFPKIIPFLHKTSTPAAMPQENVMKDLSGSSVVLTKKYVLEQVYHALKYNSFDLEIDKIFNVSTKQVALKRCFPYIMMPNKQRIFYRQLIEWALEENIHFYIDHATLGKVLQMVKNSHQQYPTLQYLCGVHLRSLMNEDFINTYIEFAQTYPELCARVIFEINFIHFNNLSMINSLQHLSIKGFNFALFSANLEFPQELLSAVSFYYYILDSHKITRHLHGDSAFPLIQPIKKFLEDHNTEMIMVNVDQEEKAITAFLKSEISYGQGEFFSMPPFTQSIR